MMTIRVFAGALIATSLSALTGAALAQTAQTATDAGANASRSVRVVYPVLMGPALPHLCRRSLRRPNRLRLPRLQLRPSSPAEQPGAPEPVGLTGPERVDINAASAEDLNRLGGQFAKAIIAGRPYG